MDFPSSPKALKRTCFGQIFCAAVKILKKNRPKKAVLGTCKILTKNSAFSARAAPSKLVIGFESLMGASAAAKSFERAFSLQVAVSVFFSV